MIVLDSHDPCGLWTQTTAALRARRLGCWELVSHNRLALFDWPTRHTKLLFRARVSTLRNKLAFMDMPADLVISDDERVQYQKELSEQLQHLFAEKIQLIEISQTRPPSSPRDKPKKTDLA